MADDARGPASSSTAAAAPIASTEAALGAPAASQGINSLTSDSTAPAPSPRAQFSFPPAAQPSIIRAFQKDAYYQSLFRASLSDTARSLLGARFLAQHAEKLSLVAGVAYWTLASGWGATQTLGEEYVNAIMVESGSGKVAGRRRRLLFVVLLALVPTLLSRAYAALRKYAQRRAATLAQQRERARIRAAAVAAARGGNSAPQTPSRSRREAIFAFLARRLPPLESLDAADGWLAYLGAAHLAVFYLGGRYYALAQRAARVQYISTIPPHPNAQPPSYEILGLLLAVQLGVKFLLTVRARLRESSQREEEEAEAQAEAEGTHSAAESREVAARRAKKEAAQAERTMRIDDQLWTHETSPATLVRARQKRSGGAPTAAATESSVVVPLLYPSMESTDLLPGASKTGSAKAGSITPQIRSQTAELAQVSDSLLRCTLCMEQRTPERGNSAVTECGHIFCWDCITGWAREKPECPLCRQSLAPSRLLPIYNF
ncbi:peroxisome biogenesis factor 10 [Tilletia horrida]|uniref:RING-type E3 ubiquitin transferase n=1 Tax=Tilletia horrida TaxID=155126 RepID=A0AAN6GG60_9BASI|nr:peroxisome biogenesis factor 10 [Tilletia horrida]KAK0559731.1 peroxisome biogenesis factor 10 [Tilletia horrida]